VTNRDVTCSINVSLCSSDRSPAVGSAVSPALQRFNFKLSVILIPSHFSAAFLPSFRPRRVNREFSRVLRDSARTRTRKNTLVLAILDVPLSQGMH
jgi:hypothetical protein